MSQFYKSASKVDITHYRLNPLQTQKIKRIRINKFWHVSPHYLWIQQSYIVVIITTSWLTLTVASPLASSYEPCPKKLKVFDLHFRHLNFYLWNWMNTFCFLRFKSQILLNHQNKLKPQMIEVLALFRAPSEHDQHL